MAFAVGFQFIYIYLLLHYSHTSKQTQLNSDMHDMLLPPPTRRSLRRVTLHTTLVRCRFVLWWIAAFMCQLDVSYTTESLLAANAQRYTNNKTHKHAKYKRKKKH